MDNPDDTLASLPGEPHSLSIQQLAAALHTNLMTGLSTASASRRRQFFGPNLTSRITRPAAWRRFLAQFHDPQIYLLMGAAAITWVVKALERSTEVAYETYIILAIVLMNAILSFLQEDRAERALTALAELMPLRSAVIRDGVTQQMDAEDLVPGDVILLSEGDMVPADARLAQASSFLSNEASLTGESLPVRKQPAPLPPSTNLADRSNMAFSGTVVTAGTATAIVTATGVRTEVGKIADLLATAEAPATPLQRQLKTLSQQLGVAVLLIATVTSVVLVAAGGSRRADAIVDVLLFAVALAVAAAPEGLAAITTLVLAIGVQRMAKQGAIVKTLSAVETLGSTTVIASDKTGTMTRNEITVRSIITASGSQIDVSGAGYAKDGSLSYHATALPTAAQKQEVHELLVALVLANNAHISPGSAAWQIQGDPTEAALLIAAQKEHLSTDEIRIRYPRVTEIPFSSERKRMTTVHRSGEKSEDAFSITKGAPDILLDLCTRVRVGTQSVPLTSQHRARILRDNAQLAQSAMRVLAVASRPLKLSTADPLNDIQATTLETDLTFLGLVGMIDPPRPEAKAAVERARGAGVRTILVTGDQPLTAIAVATELGIASDESCLSGHQLDTLSDHDLSCIVRHTQVYARVRPEHKLRIVRALQSNNEIVAMTGDGVNDAPALKAAHIGVAMGIAGTEVSRQAADLVLTDDNFSTIVLAIEQGRVIFDNIQKVVRYLLTTNLGEMSTLFLSALVLSISGGPDHPLFLPLTAAQVLWINLITDSGPALALGVDPPSSDVLRRPPRPSGAHILDAQMLRSLFPSAITMTIASLAVFFLLAPDQPLAQRRTMIFTTLILCQLFNALSARSFSRTAFRKPLQNHWLWIAILFSIGAQIMITGIPALRHAFQLSTLSWTGWLQCTLIASSVLLINELAVLHLWTPRRHSSRQILDRQEL